MCGWAGILDRNAPIGAELQAQIKRMTDTLEHRGPDDEGTWCDAPAGIALGFRRLAIVDLSPHGHQPMVSASGRYVMVFNGEVYNYAELRRELEPRGYRFRGHSDTEVMLAAIEEWGLLAAVQRFVGMFAIALWDRAERRLALVRDRLGIKPIYYGWMGTTLLFGSELKALRAHPSFKVAVDRGALSLFMRHNYVPSPHSIYAGVRQLPPGCMLELRAGVEHPTPVAYWSAKEVAERGTAQPLDLPDAEAIEQLDALLRQAIGLRMVADVPLGAFLSGGIDSSTVVALMQAQSAQPVRTFSIGFEEADYDEAGYARAVARQLGTDHTELYVTPAEAQAVIPSLPHMYDEPFADSSQIPTYLVSKLARQSVTVSLSGDGGDELFEGYSSYYIGDALWRKLRWLPIWSRTGLARGITAVPTAAYDRSFGWLAPHIPHLGAGAQMGDKMYKLAELLQMRRPEELHQRIGSHWTPPAAVVLGGYEPATVFTDPVALAALPSFVERSMYMDTVSYLPGDILTKVDRASMAVSLEARVPLLDHRVVEFAWRLPLTMKYRDGKSKWILRQVLYRYVPPALVERPKMGFGVPIGEWLRGPLRAWAEALLDERRLRDEGFFNPAPIRTKWAEHLSGARDWKFYLWDVLMFQAWWEHWGSCG